MKKLIHAMIAATALVGGAGIAQAAFLNVPLPTNAYITVGGLDWAWISPCGIGAGSCDSSNGNFFSFQGSQGWRLPTVAELANRPAASQFLFTGGNVPAGGTDPVSGATFNGNNGTAGACATPYFSGVYRHCDYGDGVSGQINNGGATETWAVRSAVSGAVPEPSTWALMLAGFGALGFALRRKPARSIAVTYA